jgi:glycosyltransferase involved in cell wall biosynthesis
MYRALRDDARTVQVLHNHGLWTMPNVYPGFAVSGTPCRLVASPRGVLDPWARRQSRFKKAAMWWLGQRLTLQRAACIHATSESEYIGIREAGIVAPVAIVPNGVDIPPPDLTAKDRDEPVRQLVFFGRIHPKKGVDTLIRAWTNVARRFRDWELHIIGPDDRGHAMEMVRLSTDLGTPRVVFRGPIYGEEKWRALGRAHLFALPTKAENFGLVVAEALASSVPAIVTKNAPWSQLESEGCGWWIEDGVDSLTATLEHALSLSPGELRNMGARGRAWVSRAFSWPAIGSAMVETYRWIVDGGTSPPWVRLH